MALRSVFWVPRKTGLCTGSHENKSARAEIRGLLKIHSNSSQAPLVADSSTSRGHGRHSYWLILSALSRFKWVTKWEARHDAECTVSVLSVTVSRAFQCRKAPTAAILRARPSNFSHTLPKYFFFFAGFVDRTSSSLSKKPSVVNGMPISVRSRARCIICWQIARHHFSGDHLECEWCTVSFESKVFCSSNPVFCLYLYAAVISLNKQTKNLECMQHLTMSMCLIWLTLNPAC